MNRSLAQPSLKRRLIPPSQVGEIEAEWSELAQRAARSPFDSPGWLLAWLHGYGTGWDTRLVTWWRGPALVAVAPIARRRRSWLGLPVREATFWGRTRTPLGGWVDLLAEPEVAATAAADLADWLATEAPRWDLFDYLHLRPDSAVLATLAGPGRPWRRVDLSGVLHSLDHELDLPTDDAVWRGQLGPKARHELRRAARLYERRLGGGFETLTDAAAVPELVAALRELAGARWGDREAYFRRDPAFGPFATAALEAAMADGTGWAVAARDRGGIAAVLFVIGGGDRAVALLIGVSQAKAHRPLSLGKALFHTAIDEAVERGYRTFSFLTEGGYKTSFWRAEGRPVASGFLGRGPVGLAIEADATVRRVWPARLRAGRSGKAPPPAGGR